jgi:FkbM family methyltransferase
MSCDSKTNGEQKFLRDIQKDLCVVFDVGSRNYSEFTDVECEVHYFEPVKHFIDELSSQSNKNCTSFFNNFGLGHENAELYYYPKYESFYNRVNSCKVSDEKNKITLRIKTAKDYIVEKNVSRIDFLKIDTEGYELNVLKGFGDSLNIVRYIQFEYGGTYLDSDVKLIEVVDYLKQFGFSDFSYLVPHGRELIKDFTDHYTYCNIVCEKAVI